MTSNASPRPTPGRRQGAVLLLGSSLTIMGSVMVAPIIPKLGAEFGPVEPRADLLIPLAMTGPALAIALFAPLAGWLADRLGRKRLLVLATLCYALLGMLPALLQSLPTITLARLVFGLAEAAVMTCCVTLIADYWQGSRRLAYVNGQVITISLVGSLFFVVGGALGEHSWRTPFYLYLLPLLLVPFMLRLLWEPSRASVQSRLDEGPERSAPLPLLVNYLLVFAGMVLSVVVPIQSPLLLVQLGVTSSTLIGASAGLGLLATLGGPLLWPLLRRWWGLAGCNAVLLACMGSGLWLLVTARNYETVLVAVTIHGLGVGMLVPNTMAPVMGALSARARGRGMGGYTGCLYLGQFASPLVVAVLLPFAGDLHLAIRALASAALVAALAWAAAGLLRRKAALPTPSRSS
ncbi:MFS transporter [Pseudomonas sp. JUb52]|uniref:MFS transporter n=1 Tax=Pseudomonas sp. JUb52 TaxID=2485127 RepID=UPI0010450AFB|nr:MFS transporter [Pseudomonas sp. JUb52]TCQ92654.1 putative MFS family arabinose efflux permease [Pseudomonas sp. JUb52]